jgi:signal transduction histidine kinase
MLKAAPETNSPVSSVANGAPGAMLRRSMSVSIPLVLALMLATIVTIVTTTFLVDRNVQRNAEADLQARVTSLARTIDVKLRTYKAALDTMAFSFSLREDFDLADFEWEARRVGELFDGWFVLSRGGDVMEILMTTVRTDGSLPQPQPRTTYPEVMRAEAESVRTGNATVSDAFIGPAVGKLVITIAKPLDTVKSPAQFIYFAVTLRDITAWLEEANLEEGEFASLADGSRRVIARSQNNQDFALAELPEWYIAFTEGRDSGTAVGPPVYGEVSRLFAMQRLEIAPGWTIAISRSMPRPFSAAYLSPWPVVSGFMTLLLGGGIAGLFHSRRLSQARAASRAVQLTELRAADARKSRLMAVLAHDLRTPLVAMLGTLDLFPDGAENPSQGRMLHRLEADGHGMLTLIDDVLELARLGAGEARLRPEPFAPLALLTQVEDLVRPTSERHGTEIVIKVDDFPMLRGDVASLRRVILNFATNAVKATRGGSIRLSATHGATGTDGHTVTFAVTDTGRGIAPEDIPRLFRDFGMLERDSTTRDGTGLGLAICRRLADAMGGKVGVESTPGEGSRFWLRLTLP